MREERKKNENYKKKKKYSELGETGKQSLWIERIRKRKSAIKE